MNDVCYCIIIICIMYCLPYNVQKVRSFKILLLLLQNNHYYIIDDVRFVEVSYMPHVSTIARTCYIELRRLASIRRFLTSTATAIFVSAFAMSRIDHC